MVHDMVLDPLWPSGLEFNPCCPVTWNKSWISAHGWGCAFHASGLCGDMLEI